MDTYQWLCVIGLPAILSGIVLMVVKGVAENLKNMRKEVEESSAAQKMGIQAMLRNELYKLYDECSTRGVSSHVERENFQNLYAQYHALGANGVMDDVRKRFMELPIQ